MLVPSYQLLQWKNSVVASAQNFVNNLQIVEKCIDDMNWKDSKYGDGKSKCSDMTQDWCQNRGDYSIEALKSCPRSCGVCKGIHFCIIKFQLSNYVIITNSYDMDTYII